MMGAQGVMIMVSMTAVARVREHYVLILVVADPIVAAFRLGQVSLLSAKTAAIFEDRVLGLILHRPCESSYKQCLYHGGQQLPSRKACVWDGSVRVS